VAELPFGQVVLAADAEHDLQRRLGLVAGGGVRHELEELDGLAVASGRGERLHGEAGVAHPRVPVVPVAACAWGLGQ
jgi:hypothetical protein